MQYREDKTAKKEVSLFVHLSLIIKGKAVPLLALEAFEQAVLFIANSCNVKRVAKFLEASVVTEVDGTENAPALPDEDEEVDEEGTPEFKAHTKVMQLEVLHFSDSVLLF